MNDMDVSSCTNTQVNQDWAEATEREHEGRKKKRSIELNNMHTALDISIWIFYFFSLWKFPMKYDYTHIHMWLNACVILFDNVPNSNKK